MKSGNTLIIGNHFRRFAGLFFVSFVSLVRAVVTALPFSSGACAFQLHPGVRAALILGCVAGALCVSTRAEALLVVPAGNEFVEGDSNNSFPFNESTMRYQQVYAGTAFGGNAGVIDEILFRVDGYDPSFVNKMLDVEIRLSHTSATPDTLSHTFADNIGADQMVVFDGLLTISGTGGGAPNPFDIVIDVDDLFSYDGVGNLLLDVTVFNGPGTSQFDSVDSAPGATLVQRVWQYDVNAVTGRIAGDRGLVTGFHFGPELPIPVVIDIMPSDPGNNLNLRAGKGAGISVAILSVGGFGAPNLIDPLTLEFGPGQANISGSPRVRDVDGDGNEDLVVKFLTHETGIACGDTEARLSGRTFDFERILGSDAINTFNCPRTRKRY